MGFTFDIITGSINGVPMIANTMAEIEEALKDVTDPAVRNEDDDENQGLLPLLRELVPVEPAPTWEVALALRVAFSLGKIAAGGKVDPAALAKLTALQDRWRRGGANGGGKANKGLADMWHKQATPVYRKLRDEFPKDSCRALAKRIVDNLGDLVPGLGRVERWVGAMDKKRAPRAGGVNVTATS
jgi:hypothetical protein